MSQEPGVDPLAGPEPGTLRAWWRHQRLLARLRWARRRGPAPTPASLLEGRRRFDDLGRRLGPPHGALVADDLVPGRGGHDVPVQWLDCSAGDADAPVVFYVHGGAYAMGSIVASRHAAATHLRAARARGLVVDYRLAPEHPHPAGLDDVEDAWDWLVRHEDPARVVALGESAGGGLVLALLVRLRRRGAPMPAAAVTISTWANLACDTPSYRERRDRDLALDVRMLEQAAAAYLGPDGRADDPDASPVHADLAGLPPLLLAVGTEEVVWDDTSTVLARARAAGTDARLLVGEGQLHCWTVYDFLQPARDAVAEIAAFVREATARG